MTDLDRLAALWRTGTPPTCGTRRGVIVATVATVIALGAYAAGWI